MRLVCGRVPLIGLFVIYIYTKVLIDLGILSPQEIGAERTRSISIGAGAAAPAGFEPATNRRYLGSRFVCSTP